VRKLAILTAVLLLAVPLHAIAEETTVTETFDNQEINTDITFVYGASDTVVSAATSQSPDCASTEEAGLIGIEDMDCFQSIYFGNDRFQLGIRGSSDSLTIAFPNEPYEVGFNYAAIDQDGGVSGVVYYDNGASENFTLDVNTDMEVAGSKVFAVAETVETFITEIVIEGITDWWLIDNVYYKYDVPDNTPPSTTTTSTTLPKAEDVVEDNVTTYLAWDEYGCEHPGNPLSYKQYLEAIESGDWFGYQPSDCTDVPDVVVDIIEEEEIEDELDEEILRDDDLGEETIQEEDVEVEDSEELTEEEIAILEAEILEAEEELLILEELEDSIIPLEDLSEEEIEELIDVIQELEELEEIVIEEEIIELDIPDDIIIVVIEEEEIEEEIIIDEAEVLSETDEEVLDEPIQEDVEEEPVELTEEEIAVEVAEVEEVIETIVVEEATTEEVIEVLEEVNDVGVQNLEDVSEEVQEVVKEIVEEAIDNVEELTEEQVEVVAEVLQVETEDVEIIAEAVKSDEAVAEAVEEYVERAVENADVEDYTLADVVTEVQFENFIENPIETLVDIDLKEINLSDLSGDMTSDQKEKAQEVVVPVILTRIASMAAFIFRRS
jgi:hypothetical protein